jgi:hypothetical protein
VFPDIAGRSDHKKGVCLVTLYHGKVPGVRILLTAAQQLLLVDLESVRDQVRRPTRALTCGGRAAGSDQRAKSALMGTVYH